MYMYMYTIHVFFSQKYQLPQLHVYVGLKPVTYNVQCTDTIQMLYQPSY